MLRGDDGKSSMVTALELLYSLFSLPEKSHASGIKNRLRPSTLLPFERLLDSTIASIYSYQFTYKETI